MGLLATLRAKLAVHRLEQRYTKQREKRTTFVSGAQYVDGEYVYQSHQDPRQTVSDKNSSSSSFGSSGRAAKRQSRLVL